MRLAAIRIATGILLLGAVVTKVNAQTAERINVVTTAVPFLRISPDARAGGMGDLGVATTPDVNSAVWNLAKTPFNEGLTYRVL